MSPYRIYLVGCSVSVLLILMPARAENRESSRKITCPAFSAWYLDKPLLRVKTSDATQRVYLQKEPMACESKSACAQNSKRPYLLNGDLVLGFSEKTKSFQCVGYGTSRGRFVSGFVPVQQLESTQESGKLDPTFLQGEWRATGDLRIVFQTVSKSEVRAEGEVRENTGKDISVGQFEATSKVDGTETTFVEGATTAEDDLACRVKVRRKGPYLLVTDNGNCGGANVSFESVYIKVTKAK